jgi:predicted glycogen debranching enzyme
MTVPLVQRIACGPLTEQNPHALIEREWLVTNGLGGYASGTIAGACTRRFHGLLIAALPAPLGRMMMFNHLSETLRGTDFQTTRLSAAERIGADFDPSVAALVEFRLESGLPVWSYEIDSTRLERRIVLPHLQNTVCILYRVLESPGPVRIRLRPSFHFRPHEGAVHSETPPDYSVVARNGRFEVHSEVAPELRMWTAAPRSSLVCDGGQLCEVRYRLEEDRGYDSRGMLWSPGYFRLDLEAGQEAMLAATTESWESVRDIDAPQALAAEMERHDRLLAQASAEKADELHRKLVLAADQFIIRPATRSSDAARAHAAGDDVRTVIAGYHWFTDWGRDTMISLEGLTLVTGRFSEAGYLLRTFGRYVRDGLIPNLFPEGQREGLYHTADATLWYFHALHRYLQRTGDRDTLRQLLPTLHDIVRHHIAGTHFGIGVDPTDDLLTQGQEGYQLTWMDAKVGDWVVTPRRGKAVEINALWYNALRLMERWSRESGDGAAATALGERADRTSASFNRRFWLEEDRYLSDIVDGERGDDPAIRPNQLLSISLDYPVLNPEHWKDVVNCVESHLLTPFGLRTLAPGHRDYKATYSGDLRSRDAAYHQGTVWTWLIGPFVDAWLKVYPGERDRARAFLTGIDGHLNEACVGTISEIFDAEAPYYPRGCAAQAWSVAEVLRVKELMETSSNAGRTPAW